MTIWQAYFNRLAAAVSLAGGIHFLEAEFSGGGPTFPYAIFTDFGPSTRQNMTLAEVGGTMRIRVDLYATDKASGAQDAEEIAQAIRGVRGLADEHHFDLTNDVTMRYSELAVPGHYRWIVEARVAYREAA